MPKQSASPVFYATATKTTVHGAPCIEHNVPGVAVKQQSPQWDTAVASQKTIAIGEAFLILCKGEVEVPTIAGAVRGSPVYIHKTTNALTLTDPGVGNGVAYGRVAELAGQRGTPLGKIKVDLDHRDTVPAAA